ncbi:MAG TPA: acylphosphatase [Stellaceae bacterium]|nr:acylphosphatase [Stellaceae bacterium]
MPAVRLTISGRVQGVGFRAFVEREASKRGLRGWVRNRRHGTVETLLIGEAAVLAEMETACERGPSFARVTAVERHSAEDDGTPGFEQRPTV